MARLHKIAEAASRDWRNISIVVDGFGCFLFEGEHSGSPTLKNHHIDSADTWQHDQFFHLGGPVDQRAKESK